MMSRMMCRDRKRFPNWRAGITVMDCYGKQETSLDNVKMWKGNKDILKDLLLFITFDDPVF